MVKIVKTGARLAASGGLSRPAGRHDLKDAHAPADARTVARQRASEFRRLVAWYALNRCRRRRFFGGFQVFQARVRGDLRRLVPLARQLLH